MSGLQVERKLKAVSPKMRVIIITANENDSLQDDLIRNGVIAFFVKPFNDTDFLAAVYQAMASAP